MVEAALSNSDESSSESEGDDTNDEEIDGLLDDLLDDLTADDPPNEPDNAMEPAETENSMEPAEQDNAQEPAKTDNAKEPSTSSNEIVKTAKADESSTSVSSNIQVDKKNSPDETQIKGPNKPSAPKNRLFTKEEVKKYLDSEKALRNRVKSALLDEKKVEISSSPIQHEHIKFSNDSEFILSESISNISDISDSLSDCELSEDCISGPHEKTPERDSRKRPVESSSLALSRRILRTYKRRAMMKSSPMKSLATPIKTRLPKELSSDDDGDDSDDDILVIDERQGDPLEVVLPISIDKTLGRCGTTVRKVLIPKAPPKVAELAIGEPQGVKPARASFEPMKSPPAKVTYFPHMEANQKLKIMRYHHGRIMPPLRKQLLLGTPPPPIPVPRQLKSQTRSVDKLLKKLPSFEFRRSESSETDKTPKDNGPSTSTAISTSVEVSSDTKSLTPATTSSTSPTSSNSKVRLWKTSTGSYTFGRGGRVLPKESCTVSFPKAIIYPNKAQLKNIVNEMGTKYSVNLEVERVEKSEEPLQPAVPAPSTGRKSVLSVESSAEDLLRSHELQAIRLCHSPSHAERNKTPEPVKYIIPQGMLASVTDKVQHIQEPSSSEGSPQHENDSDQFMFENDEDDKKPQATESSKSRRKATIIPKEDDDEMLFEEPPFEMPPRPQSNIELIANLAKYRVLVRNILEKLNVPQIDFNSADGDDYINIYKIYRNGS